MEREVTLRPASLTIVGGQPTPQTSSERVDAPQGIERLLLLAARDDGFADRLLESRERAVEESGLDLNPVEQATLSTVSDDALRAMIIAVGASARSRRDR